jgi:tRNA pseudouridine13 synthase
MTYVEMKRIVMSGATRYNKKVKVGNFSYQNKEIRLGDLAGNRFELAIRNLDRTDEQLRPVLEAFKETGFINYFGMQRQISDLDLV